MSNSIGSGISETAIRDAIIDDATRFSGADVVPKEDIRDVILDDATPFSGADIPCMTPYYYYAELPPNTDFIPPAKTIVLTSFLAVSQGLEIRRGTVPIKAAANLGATERGYIGTCYCDGTAIRFRNTTGVQYSLYLYGVTIP